jgi:hypothetical protein
MGPYPPRFDYGALSSPQAQVNIELLAATEVGNSPSTKATVHEPVIVHLF